MASVWTYPEEENFSSRSFPLGPSARYPQVSLTHTSAAQGAEPQTCVFAYGPICAPGVDSGLRVA